MVSLRARPADHAAGGPRAGQRAAGDRGLRTSRGDRRGLIGRGGWLLAGREALIRDGIAGVQVGKLARRLRVTRGGFYWFFNSRQHLLDELLRDWERTNTAAFEAVLREARGSGMAEFHALVEVWISESRYSPKWDSAIRDWARVARKVAAAVHRVDEERVRILKQIFLDLGYADDEAFVRARVCYFHQVGYYALGVRESRQARLKLLPLYVRILTGRDA